jgi:hypothetical protein
LQFRKGQKYVKPAFGPNPILSNDEEQIVVTCIFENHKRGFPRRKEDVQESVNFWTKIQETIHLLTIALARHGIELFFEGIQKFRSVQEKL